MPTPEPSPPLLLHVPFPVEFGPHVADWWMVWLAGIGVVVSALIALSAVTAARSARDIAKESEKARVDSETARANREYGVRLDEALTRVLTAIASHLDPLRQWLSEVDDAEMHNRIDRYGELLVSEAPTLDRVDIEAQIVRMIAVGQDAKIVEGLANSLALIGNARPYLQEALLKGIVHVVREWRSGERSPEDSITWFDSFQVQHGHN